MLFKFSTYSAAVDIFAVGCIIAEMYLGKPLFLGQSEMDQISKIASILGSPGNNWPDGMKQAVKKGIGIAEYPEIPFSAVIPNCPSDALSFITECLRWDPMRRMSSAQMVNHPFLNKENIEVKTNHHEMGFKKINSMGEKVNYKMERETTNNKSPLKSTSVKATFDKDDDFDQLLNDFKNYQVSGKKDDVRQKEEEDEWL